MKIRINKISKFIRIPFLFLKCVKIKLLLQKNTVALQPFYAYSYIPIARMKTDFYTKSILTVIAICLVLLVVKDFSFTSLKADSGAKVNTNYGLIPINADGSINVVMKSFPNSTMDVQIVGVSTYDKLKVDVADISTSNELDVNIDEVSGSSVWGGVPVNIKKVADAEIIDHQIPVKIK